MIIHLEFPTEMSCAKFNFKLWVPRSTKQMNLTMKVNRKDSGTCSIEWSVCA